MISDLAAQSGRFQTRIIERHPVHGDLPALDRFEAVHAANQGTFSRTARATNNHNLPGLNFEIHILEDVEIPKPLVDSLEFDHSTIPVDRDPTLSQGVFTVNVGTTRSCAIY